MPSHQFEFANKRKILMSMLGESFFTYLYNIIFKYLLQSYVRTTPIAKLT